MLRITLDNVDVNSGSESVLGNDVCSLLNEDFESEDSEELEPHEIHFRSLDQLLTKQHQLPITKMKSQQQYQQSSTRKNNTGS